MGSAGNSDEVAAVIEAQFESYTACPEPEESIKQAARALIAKTLAGKIPAVATTVAAFGSQTTRYGINGGADEVSNSLHISIT